jgi:hypothetical protein
MDKDFQTDSKAITSQTMIKIKKIMMKIMNITTKIKTTTMILTNHQYPLRIVRIQIKMR